MDNSYYEFEELLEESITLLKDFGVNKKFWSTSAGIQLIQSLALIKDDDNESFINQYELSGALLEGMTSVFKEEALKKSDAYYHSTADGRLVTSVVASEDGMQENALHLVSSAKGVDVMHIYQEIYSELGLHCPTCSCETRLMNHSEILEKRENYVDKLKEILDDSD